MHKSIARQLPQSGSRAAKVDYFLTAINKMWGQAYILPVMLPLPSPPRQSGADLVYSILTIRY